uniref:Uncharacterized protein n=1 Tax=Panagrolaimus davidi TaxID=227884 RepID=A0A914PLA2_9BILA
MLPRKHVETLRMFFVPFTDCSTFNAQYKKLCHHPDKGGDTIIMTRLNALKAAMDNISPDEYPRISNAAFADHRDFREHEDIDDDASGSSFALSRFGKPDRV